MDHKFGYVMTRRILSALLLCLSTALAAQAQTGEYSFERIRIPGGIEENRVGVVVQDHQGYLWIRTTGGIFKYDGYTFTKYGHSLFKAAEAQAYETFWEIHMGPLGFLWIGTSVHGLHRFDPITEEIVSYRHDPADPTSITSNNVLDIIHDRYGTLWVSTDRGLNRFDPPTEVFKSYRYDPKDSTSISSDLVWRLYLDRDGTIWAGTRTGEGLGGLNRFNPHTETFTRYLADLDDPSALKHPHIGSMFEDSRGRFWVGTPLDGLHMMDREHGTFTRYPYDPDHPERLSRPHVSTLPKTMVRDLSVSDFYEDPSGILWIGAHTGGINLYDGDLHQLRHYEADRDTPGSLANNVIRRISASRDGVVWIGTNSRGGEGLHKATRITPYQFYSTQSAQGQVKTLIESIDGRIWAGTYDAGLYSFDRRSGEVTNYEKNADRSIGLRSSGIGAISQTKDSFMWIGYSTLNPMGDGMDRFDPNTGPFERVLEDPDDPERSVLDVMAIHEDRNGLLWIGTQWDGLVLFDRMTGSIVRYRNDPDDPRSLSSNRLERDGIHETSDGSIWIETRGGLNRFDTRSKTFERYFAKRSLRSQMSGVGEGEDEVLWIGWMDGWLTRFDPRTHSIEYIDGKNAGLPGSVIASILVDDLGNPWVMTEETIARFDVEDGRFYTHSFNRSGAVFAGPGSGAFKNKAGELFFGTVDGVVVFKPEDMLAIENRVPPNVVLTAFRTSSDSTGASRLDEPLTKANSVRLRHDQNSFSFQFAGLHYTNPERNRHQFMLEGYEDAWREAGEDRTARYDKVPSGSYKFRVRAANPFGVWSNEDATMAVIVLPPWWQAWWAYGFYVLGLGLVVFGGYELRVRRLRKRAEALGSLVDERTRDLQAEKARTEAQAKRLIELDEVKDRFFFNMSHEFRTPLTLILGPLQDLLSSGDKEISSGLKKKLLGMQRNGQRLHRLIGQLLDLSKLEVGRMPLQAQQRDLVSFVRHIVLSFAPAAERKKITLKYRVEVEELPVFIDADKLEHVITNLLSNALKFTSEHGKILVGIAESLQKGRRLAEVSVKDTGVGIPAKELPFIFDRFHQAESSRTRSGDGAGIGLSLAQEMVELHGGEIEVESEESFGTTFTIRLRIGRDHLLPNQVVDEDDSLSPSRPPESEPHLAAELPAQENAPSPDVVAIPSASPLVLVIDDNEEIRDYLRGHLEEHYRVMDASDGDDGLQKAQEERPDLILADIMMPGMDGLELCRVLKEDETTAHIPVILLTARASEEAEVEGLEAGADDYVSKPFSAEALLARVENLIEIRKFLKQRFSDQITVQSLGVTVESVDGAFLERVKEAIEAHIDDSGFTVEWLADEASVSPRQLRRKLRELLNLSPSGYIRMIRLEHAAELLKNGAGNVSEVAYRVGFNDPRYFSRLFRQTFSVSPSSYAQR